MYTREGMASATPKRQAQQVETRKRCMGGQSLLCTNQATLQICCKALSPRCDCQARAVTSARRSRATRLQTLVAVSWLDSTDTTRPQFAPCCCYIPSILIGTRRRLVVVQAVGMITMRPFPQLLTLGSRVLLLCHPNQLRSVPLKRQNRGVGAQTLA